MLDKNKLIVVLQGGSGSGKTLLTKMLQQQLNIPRVVTCTTREIKEGELPGVDYYYLTRDEFLQRDLVEYAEYAGNLYGTDKLAIETLFIDHDVISIILEENGVKKLKDMYPNNVLIVSLPISKDTAEDNMLKRNDPNIDIRLATISKNKEYLPLDIADIVLTGNDLDTKLTKLKEVIEVVRKHG